MHPDLTVQLVKDRLIALYAAAERGDRPVDNAPVRQVELAERHAPASRW